MNLLNIKTTYLTPVLIIVSAGLSAFPLFGQTPAISDPATKSQPAAPVVSLLSAKNDLQDNFVRQARDKSFSALLPPSINPNDSAEPKAINPPRIPSDALRHLSLDNAIDLLTQNNLSVIAARYNVNLAVAQKVVAGLRPSASVTVTVNQLTIPRLLRTPKEFYTTNGNAAANATYTVEYDRLIERGNKRNLRITQAELNSRAAETQVRDALRQQIFQLKQSFLAALLARENLRVAVENYGSFNKSQIILASQVAEGYAAGVDLKRIELQKLSFQRDISNSELTFQQSIRDVYNLIGIGDNVSLVDEVKAINYDSTAFMPQLKESLEILDGNLDFEPALFSISELRRLALENRPDVKTSELNLEAAKAGLKLAQAQRSRDITVGVQYMRSGSDNAIGVVTTIPVSIQKRAELLQTEAQINIKIAESQLRQVQTQALTDVEKAFTAYMISRERLRLFTGGSLKTALDVRRIEEISYRDGVKSLLDYLDAQHIYNQTVTDFNQSRYDYLLSLTQLESAVGTKLPVR